MGPTTFSLEDITNFCPPCPPAFTDDGRFFWLTAIWLVLLLILWPYRKLNLAAPKQRVVWGRLGGVIFTLATMAVILTAIIYFTNRTDSLTSSVGAFIRWAAGIPSASACLGCADLQGTVFNLIGWINGPLMFLSLLALLNLRRRVSVAPGSPEPRLSPSLWLLVVCQLLSLVPYVFALVAFGSN